MSVGHDVEKRKASEVVYRFRWKLLEPGDVICSTIPSDRISRLIRTLTWSNYSHVSMCVEPKGCIEANENVARFSVLHVGCRDRKNVRVLRLRSSIQNADNIRSAAAEEALKFLGQDYWTGGAVKSLFRWLPPSEQPGAFCSHLVACAYEAAKFEILPGISVQKVTPKNIANSPLFDDVSDQILEEVPSGFVNSAFEYLDDARSVNNPHLKENSLGIEVCSHVAKDFERENRQRPKSLMEAQEIVLDAFKTNRDIARRLDEALSLSLQKHYYADEIIRLISSEPLYDPDELVAWLLTNPPDAQITHIFKECTDLRAGSELSIKERLEQLRCYEEATKAGLTFAIELAKLSKFIYETYTQLMDTNDLCIKILITRQVGQSFVGLAPSGNPLDLLNVAGGTEGIFVLEANQAGLQPRKYGGRLQDCLQSYAQYLGYASQGIGVTVWKESNDEFAYFPPPPMKEASWLVKPVTGAPREVKDMGPTTSPR